MRKTGARLNLKKNIISQHVGPRGNSQSYKDFTPYNKSEKFA
jgi:hypothetical protein